MESAFLGDTCSYVGANSGPKGQKQQDCHPLAPAVTAGVRERSARPCGATRERTDPPSAGTTALRKALTKLKTDVFKAEVEPME